MTTIPFEQTAKPSRDLHDRYLLLLGFMLAGYAAFGKGFAYIGYPPLFIGEVVLLLGLAALVRSGGLIVAIATPASLTMLAFMIWVAFRTIPGIGIYGLEAVRDSVIGLYGLFSIVIAALVIERPRRILMLLRWFSRFSLFYPVVALFSCLVFRFYGSVLPVWPGSGVQIIFLRAGELSCHLAGITIFVILALGKSTLPWVVSLLACLIVAGSMSRGGMLAFLVPVCLAVVLTGAFARLWQFLITAIVLVLLSLSAEFLIASDAIDMRAISSQQVLNNFISIFSSTGDMTLDGTKIWRLHWWDAILNYTVYGEHFWSGRGFGINIAIEDGYQQNDPEGGAPLRSPHNAHMTVLARAGVPGAVIWAVMLITWGASMLLAALRSHRAGAFAWSRLFIFLFCYWLAFLINATFDVALEGPMIGIWFWTIHGLGVGAMMLRAAEEGRSG
ncbi:O-antigen ligase family protein (plasmid) [Skermanella rosea]|uniref:O-antigen ligase family protein n=1 Tax=Skermanella rosea TaxID=1817965 RepID=UPI001931D35C|nr:O-antigen ligase family protein [Skermanella rosea]UEM07352.1 O-antigen ligase family protein [Skermanella rosea]